MDLSLDAVIDDVLKKATKNAQFLENQLAHLVETENSQQKPYY